jgi:predicted nucleic acid-binding protein/plasmid stability protein
MAHLKIRNLDDFVASALKPRAKSNRVSVEEEVRRRLAAALRAATAGQEYYPVDSVATIREQREGCRRGAGAAGTLDRLNRPASHAVGGRGALRRKVAAGELTGELAVQGPDFVLAIVAREALRLHPDEAVIPPALALSIVHQQTVPDCLYLALAEETGTGLATADLRLGEIARTRQVLTLLVPSA